MDILKDGIVLFEEPGHAFVEPLPLSREEALRETQEYFDEWYESARRRLEIATEDLAKGYLKEAAFDFHQAVERFYHCLFLVRTLWSPKSHNLNRLRDLAEELEPGLKAVWPRTTRAERRRYSLLRDAYIKARYSLRITSRMTNFPGSPSVSRSCRTLSGRRAKLVSRIWRRPPDAPSGCADSG
jgi:HEPN domain-containing protein